MQVSGYPRIGVSINIDAEKMSVQNLNENYAAAMYDAGAIPLAVPVPCIERRGEYDLLAARALEGLDGLLLTGGGDVDAVRYGERNFSFNGSFTEERDLFEIALCLTAAEQKKPVLGICRGEQLLNVAMGGTLFQDITKQHAGKELLLHAQKAPPYTPAHDVEVAEDSLLTQVLFSKEDTGISWKTGRRMVRVNSYHHQAVKDAAPGFRAAATAPDGIIEAIEPQNDSGFKGNAFTIGVQWHPERMYKHHKSAERLFAKFVEACKNWSL